MQQNQVEGKMQVKNAKPLKGRVQNILKYLEQKFQTLCSSALNQAECTTMGPIERQFNADLYN